MATNIKTKEGASAAKPARPRRPSKRKQVEQHARSYFDAFIARDPEAMASHWDADGVEDFVPLGTVLRGPGEVKGFFRELFAAIPDADTVLTRLASNDRLAAVEWRMAGTFSGAPFQGIEPTGRRIDVRGIDLLEIEDGRIVRNTVYYDGADFARQIGMLPPLDSGAERAMKGTFNAVTKLRQAVAQRGTGS